MIQEFHELFKKQECNEEIDIIEQGVRKSHIQAIEGAYGTFQTQELLSKERKLAYFLARKYSQIQRIRLVKTLAKVFPIAVFGEAKWQDLLQEDKHLWHGDAEHEKIMPQIFAQTQINLNITRPFVEQGLPMRVFDVLACQSFLLSNKAKDLDSLFHQKKSYASFHDIRSLFDRIEYFLCHEKQCQEKALSAYEEICQKHSFIHRVQSMIEVLEKRKLSIHSKYKTCIRQAL